MKRCQQVETVAAPNRMERLLIRRAADVRKLAYAPYSGFRVGAALLADSGKIYCGVNVENASFGATICAERNAVWQAVAAGERRFRMLALVTGQYPPAVPCGLCLQVLSEFCADLPLLLADVRGRLVRASLRQLLTRRFYLKK
jgi:cytidine deaminase